MKRARPSFFSLLFPPLGHPRGNDLLRPIPVREVDDRLEAAMLRLG
jgi:hypothetical protein